MITEFRDEYAFLSNFYPWAFNFRGIWMTTAEHAFQAWKAESIEERLYIASAHTPGKAKYRGRNVKLRSDWERVKIPLMFEILHAKFLPLDRRAMLLSTGDVDLVEGNYWHDQFWGNCLCQNCTTPGRNYLGRLLKLLRQELKGYNA